MTMLIFGLPGTGKTSLSLRYRRHVTLDLGSDVLTQKQYDKLRAFTTQNLVLTDLCWDSFPQYFDPAKLALALRKEQRLSSLSVHFAVPLSVEARDLVLNRVIKRDSNTNKAFVRYYAQHIDEWVVDWLTIIEEWNRYFPIWFCEYYDNDLSHAKSEELIMINKWDKEARIKWVIP